MWRPGFCSLEHLLGEVGTKGEIKTNCYTLYVDIERKDGCSLGRVRGLGRFLREVTWKDEKSEE